MRTRTVISKIRWIRSQLSDELEEWLFFRGDPKDTESFNLVAMIHDTSRFAEMVSRDAAAVEICRAFGVGPLTDRNELIKWLDFLLHQGRTHMSRDAETEKGRPPLPAVTTAWWTMIDSADPIEKLTTPEEMRTPELPETFISFELVGIAAETTPLPLLTKATAFAQEAYETVCRAYQTKGSGTLAVVKVESGFSIRIDCKGLGEPIKHLKDLILEAWNKLRHKRADEVLENSKVVLGSLKVIEQIAARERDGSLSREEAEQLRRKVITSVCGLFECGALIAEIPSQETVENTKLLNGFVPKRLAPPKAGDNTGTKKAVRKKTTPKKRSSTRHKTSMAQQSVTRRRGKPRA